MEVLFVVFLREYVVVKVGIDIFSTEDVHCTQEDRQSGHRACNPT